MNREPGALSKEDRYENLKIRQELARRVWPIHGGMAGPKGFEPPTTPKAFGAALTADLLPTLSKEKQRETGIFLSLHFTFQLASCLQSFEFQRLREFQCVAQTSR